MSQQKVVFKDSHFQAPEGEEEAKSAPAIPGERRYDIYITYYEYERVPRMWFEGYQGGQPLSYKEMLEDVMTDYAEKTVTYEPHPFLSKKPST